MSVADKLGKGTSFSRVPHGRSERGRAKAVTQGDIPAYELVRLPLDRVAPTPLNPRRNFGTDDEKTRFGEELRQAQLAACVAVTKAAYLALWPDHEARIGDVDHVLVNGERRYRSAAHVGVEALDFVVRDDLASSREEFVDHLLKENLEREDFDVIERARGVQELVDVCAEHAGRGARTRAAERLGRDRSWVTNQLDLLDLPVEIQTMLSSGELAERDGRALARHRKKFPGIEAAELVAHLKTAKEEEARAKAEEKAILEAAKSTRSGRPGTGLLSADNNKGQREAETAAGNTSNTQDAAADKATLLSTDNKAQNPAPPLAAPSESVPADNTAEGRGAAKIPQQVSPGLVDALPWQDPLWFDLHLRKHMSKDNRAQLVRLLQADGED